MSRRKASNRGRRGEKVIIIGCDPSVFTLRLLMKRANST